MSSLQRMCRELESAVGKPLQTSRDFDCLSRMIAERMRERISPTTLKRLWGYLNEENNPRKYTLNLLSRFLGYRDFEHFSQQQGVVQSGFVESAVLCAKATKCYSVGHPIAGANCAIWERISLWWRVCLTQNLWWVTRLCVLSFFKKNCSLFLNLCAKVNRWATMPWENKVA